MLNYNKQGDTMGVFKEQKKMCPISTAKIHKLGIIRNYTCKILLELESLKKNSYVMGRQNYIVHSDIS